MTSRRLSRLASTLSLLALAASAAACSSSSDDATDSGAAGSGGDVSFAGKGGGAGAAGAKAGASGKAGSAGGVSGASAKGGSGGGAGGSVGGGSGKGGASVGGTSGVGGGSGKGGASSGGGGGSSSGGSGGTSSGKGGSSTGGMSSGGTSSGGTSSGGSGGSVATPAACANPPCLNVVNACPFPLWIHAKSNAGVVLAPDDAKVDSGAVHQFDMPAEWPAARVNAYWVDPNGPSPQPDSYEKVELTFTNGTMNYNITYVDYVALPSRMEAVGPSCQKTGTFDPAVGCYVKSADLLANCPPSLVSGKRCLSAGIYCSDPNHQGDPLCHALDSTLAACESQDPGTCGVASQLGNGTPNVYGCSGYFDSQPPNCGQASKSCHTEGNKWCAALNRGMLNDPESTDTSKFYKNGPYNAYSKWVHDTCPGIYAFAYDDYPSGAGESGFRSCKADRLDVTFCPGG
jgi:hypothetical protein